jgi:nucleotide-binding universal stress UspA family protein
MKKIIAAIDGLKFSDSTRDFAVDIARRSNAHLVGVFLDDETYTSYKVYDLVVQEGAPEARLKKFDAQDRETRSKAAVNFANACRKAELTYALHHDRGIAIQELIHESIYADLLVIDAKETLTHYDEKPPTRFIRDLLSDVQCPVLLVPKKFKPVEKIMLLYDGEPSSVFAARMFSYLFGFFSEVETEVLSVKNVNQTLHLPDNKLMKEFMKRHFPRAGYKVLKGIAEVEITEYLKTQKQNLLIVLGAYRRGRVSRWFRQSMADVLMKELKAPLFIAHNK